MKRSRSTVGERTERKDYRVCGLGSGHSRSEAGVVGALHVASRHHGWLLAVDRVERSAKLGDAGRA